MTGASTAGIDDYRVYVDTEKRQVRIVFTAGDIDMTVTVNERDAQKIIDALTRAVQQLSVEDCKH